MHVAWSIETSNDAEKWRSMGTAWTLPDEPLLIHGTSKFVRYRSGKDGEWMGPLERSGSECMAHIDLVSGVRVDLFPGDEHIGLPVLLPGGETGRLLRFEHADDGYSWTYALEFKGEVPERYR